MAGERYRYNVDRRAPVQEQAILVQAVRVDGFEFDYTEDPIVLEPGDRFQIANRPQDGGICIELVKTPKQPPPRT